MAGDHEFAALDEFRSELLVHCYRRLLPSGLGGPSQDPAAPLAGPPEAPWLRPLPDSLLAAEQLDPAAVTASRAGVRLAMVAALLDRFAAAFEDGDMAALAALLRADVALEMPPLATWFSGRETALGYLALNMFTTAGQVRLVPVAANGQPAFAAYLRDGDGVYRAHAMIVLTLTGTLITRIVIFLEPELLRLFGLPREHGRGESADLGWSTSPGPENATAVEQDASKSPRWRAVGW